MRCLKRAFKHSVLLACLLLMANCAGIDCPLDNVVYSHWSFYSQEGAVTLTDTLYVYAKVNGADSLVVNRLYNASDMDVQLSYFNPIDTFVLEVHHPLDSVTSVTYQDQVVLNKEDVAHFNSPECGVWQEHDIISLTTTHNMLDSITIVRPKIDTNEEENFRIYFK